MFPQMITMGEEDGGCTQLFIMEGADLLHIFMTKSIILQFYYILAYRSEQQAKQQSTSGPVLSFV